LYAVAEREVVWAGGYEMGLAGFGGVGVGAHAVVAVDVVFVWVGVDGWVGHVVAVYGDLLAFGYDGAVGEDDGAFGFAAHCYCLV
jgi:nitrogen fixation protein FixH